MKITKSQLDQIIREEAANILDEAEGDIPYSDLARMYGGGAMKPMHRRATAHTADPKEPTPGIWTVVEYLRRVVNESPDEFKPAEIHVLMQAAEILHGKSGVV